MNTVNGWPQYADALAGFWLALANRTDVWGGHWPLSLRDQLGKLYTAPIIARRGRDLLTADVIRRHMLGADVGDVIGLHTTSPANTSHYAAFDLDAHGEAPTPEHVARVAAALRWLIATLADRCALLCEDSDGRGSFHLWMRFAVAVPTEALFHWLHGIASHCHAATGVRPEIYPKQARIPRDGFGNWLRLPGRHHTRSHWSRVCRPGDPWASGDDAARVMLEQWPTTPVAVVPPYVAPVVASAPSPYAFTVRSLVDTPRDRAAVIRRYLDKLPHGDAGTERSTKLFHLARFLRHAMQCTDLEALPILHAWDAGNRPPLGSAKIITTWSNAGKYAGTPVTLRARRHHAA